MKDDLVTKNSVGAESAVPSISGSAALGMGAVGFGLTNVAALPEAFERFPIGAGMVGELFIAFLIYRVIIALITNLTRRK